MAEMTTAITLPEALRDLPYSNGDDWVCPDCGNQSDYNNWITVRVYNVESAQECFADMSNYDRKVGKEDKWVRLLKAAVSEDEMEECPNCELVEFAENLEYATNYTCSHCGEYHDSSHDALICCDEDHPEDCPCLDGIPRNSDQLPLYPPIAGLVFACRCAEGGDEKCGNAVCAACHESMSEAPMDVRIHVARCEQKLASTPNCMCGTDFCCEVHNRHSWPHLGCDLA